MPGVETLGQDLGRDSGLPMALRPGSGDPQAEQKRFRDALAAASKQIAALMDTADEQAAAILEFQVAMLEDTELYGPVLRQMEEGVAAAPAWIAALDVQIAGYETADDSYFRARAADLADIKERVLRNLAGQSDQAAQAGGILTGRDITPTRFLEIDWSAGGAIALAGGSPSSHVAMLARARGVPMVTGLAFGDLNGHRRALVDGEAGTVVLSPGQQQMESFRARLAQAEEEAEWQFTKTN